MCSVLRDVLIFWKISDNISETVYDRQRRCYYIEH